MEALNNEASMARQILAQYQRAKILEVYFERIDGRDPGSVSSDLKPLYELPLPEIKAYLLGQHPQDNLLSQIIKLMA